ncbi:Fe-S cluster assembly sulfur transfer protein SufU [Actinotignum sanguinis]|uniref:Fe-S cluster assembly sulfur transfer protein SufU n=1 Tax=Actinotignum sanguinis TaxID=1445614 RepID=UPI00237ED693|nr:SUF system NifU family Fe-S cluster assembly protein [Actinotignum sanguinis]MDE1566043.1 SUF system NifU family Fe-S cluster assembly protein [Actinotignum sanguinis]MDE1577044.1 SUF system NifU family Fe-S cluster assembly protein [Actinotignum sanguinis]MDE1642479.1 SUF system NifU family Fe-S cluster assembly protein [Actinotignum sanguinis]MDK8656856.1 SUF system NifU family Fe-S cluster assembly protein [Actinotignum sanguinis]
MSELDELYQQIILDAARERHGEGELAPVEAGAGAAGAGAQSGPCGESTQVNPMCGDEVTLEVRLSPDGEKIAELAWRGQGCSISQASISIMNDLVAGQSIEHLAALYTYFREMMDSRGAELSEAAADALEDAAAFHGVARFPMRIKCALLGWMAVREATDEALQHLGNSNGQESISATKDVAGHMPQNTKETPEQ